MFVGHTAVALAAKWRAPRMSLGALLAAAYALDLIWPVFLLLGLERVRIDPGNTRFTPLAFDSYPWSHSLLMAVAWGLIAAILARSGRADRQAQVVVALLVVSHWVLDVASHRADMPLWPGESPHLGLGLWNSVPATFAIEGAMLACGVVLYARRTRPMDRTGSIAFRLLIAVQVLLWVPQPWSPPPSPRFLAWFGFGAWLFPPWAFWVDRHRTQT